MNAFITVLVFAMAGGILAGALVHLKADPHIRDRAERSCLKFGHFGVLFTFAPLAIIGDKPALVPVFVTLGLIVGIPLVAGLVLRASRRASVDI